MRSKRICALVETVLALALAGEAHAEPTTTRLTVNAAELPLASPEGWKIDPKLAVLPGGVREGARPPSSWPLANDEGTNEHSRCLDDRRGAVEAAYGGTTYTTRIFESGGKEYLDRATVETKGGTVHVTDAFRTPVVRVAAGVWAYRTKEGVQLVTAVDEGMFDHAVFYGCAIREQGITSPAGTTTMVSSAEDADRVMREMRGDRKRALPRWIGVDMTVHASVSRSSADPGPMLRVIVTRGRESSP